MGKRKEKIIPGEGLTNWQSNPEKAKRIWELDTPQDQITSRQREHWDGTLDAKVYPKAIKGGWGSAAEKAGMSPKEAREMRNDMRSDARRRAAEKWGR